MKELRWETQFPPIPRRQSPQECVFTMKQSSTMKSCSNHLASTSHAWAGMILAPSCSQFLPQIVQTHQWRFYLSSCQIDIHAWIRERYKRKSCHSARSMDVLIWTRWSPKPRRDTEVSRALANHMARKWYVVRTVSSILKFSQPLHISALLPPGCPSCYWQVTELWSKAYYPDRYLSVPGFSDGLYQPLASSTLCLEGLVMHFGRGMPIQFTCFMLTIIPKHQRQYLRPPVSGEDIWFCFVWVFF